jgi:putative restriction endonuclease
LNFYVGVTDKSWFDFLAALRPDEVNFWQPRGGQVFKALSPGELFLFKLHAPHNFIVGGGVFVSHSILPISLAWETFGAKNGASEYITFRQKVLQYHGLNAQLSTDPIIGCIILAQPFFFSRAEWIPVPEDFHPNIVRGKSYTTDSGLGASLWSQVQQRLLLQDLLMNEVISVTEEPAHYGVEYLIKARLGQGAFRVLVTDAYSRRCAMTGEKTLPVLESAHIKPYARSGPHNVNNGLLLRSDLHKLFDLGYVTVTTDFRVEVSNRIKEEFENGHDYYALQGRALISMPSEPLYRPSREYIDWHNNNVYLP